MREWLDWLLREPGAVVAVNMTVAGTASLAGVFGVRLEAVGAHALAACVFMALTAINAVAAGRHAGPRQLLFWSVFAVFELVALAASWAAWSLGGRTA